MLPMLYILVNQSGITDNKYWTSNSESLFSKDNFVAKLPEYCQYIFASGKGGCHPYFFLSIFYRLPIVVFFIALFHIQAVTPIR